MENIKDQIKNLKGTINALNCIDHRDSRYLINCIDGIDLYFTELERQLEGFKDQYNINSELTEQIEKMKCCRNCQDHNYKSSYINCNLGNSAPRKENRLSCCDNWELKK